MKKFVVKIAHFGVVGKVEKEFLYIDVDIESGEVGFA